MIELDRPQPYIGISGIAHYEQHGELFDIAQRERIGDLGYFVMVGVQSSGKTQVLDIENRHGRMWHPVGDEIGMAAANEDSGLTKPYVHTALKDEELETGIANIMRRTLHYVRGLQFNGLPWLDRDYRGVLWDFKDKFPYQSVILQASGRLLNAHGPRAVAATVKSMPVDYVLVDPSGGTGQPMDVVRMREYVDELYQQQVPQGIVVAGGLSGRNVQELFGPLAADYPGLSCDAEGRLRTGPEGATVIDMAAVDDFVVAWKQIVTA